jgi:hypothetical protein
MVCVTYDTMCVDCSTVSPKCGLRAPVIRRNRERGHFVAGDLTGSGIELDESSKDKMPSILRMKLFHIPNYFRLDKTT